MTDKSAPTPKFWQNQTFQVNSILFLGLVAVCWVYFGFAFGPHPIDGGDTVQFIATSVFDQHPSCTGPTNAMNPYRPFEVTPICLTVRIFGPNVLALFVVGVWIYAILAFVWQGVIRNIFNIPAWLGFIVAVVSLSYPDLRLQICGNCLTRMAGPALVLTGCWIVLSYWVRHRPGWWLILGCCVALVGFLTNESLFGAWVLGLPAALAYKERRFSRRWLQVTAVVTALTIGYLFWRLVIMPRTFTVQTIVTGGSASPIMLDPLNVMRQLGQAYGLLFRLWGNYLPLPGYLLSGPDALRTLLVLTATVGVVLLAFVFIIRRSQEPIRQSCLRSVYIGPRLFAAALLAIPVMALPYLVTTIDAMGSGYISFGTGFCASLAVAALLITSKQWKTTMIRVAIGTTILVALATMSAGAVNQAATVSPLCDFASQFTHQVAQLPTDYFVVVKSKTAPDEWALSTFMGYLYYSGPTGIDSYDLGRMGYQGYYFIRTPNPVISPGGIQINWNELIHTGVLYRFQPVPRFIPLSQAILVEYEPFGKLTFTHVPDELKSLIANQTTDTSPAQARLQRLCDPR